LGIFGSVLGFILYFYILKRIEPIRVALITLITPITALFLGQNLNGEVIHASVWIGTGVVLGGLGLVQRIRGDHSLILGINASMNNPFIPQIRCTKWTCV